MSLLYNNNIVFVCMRKYRQKIVMHKRIQVLFLVQNEYSTPLASLTPREYGDQREIERYRNQSES